MTYIADKIFRDQSPNAPLIHEDTKGVLPAGRIGIAGESGEPAVSSTLMSILAYDPLADDAAQWHPITRGWHGAFQDSTTQAIASTTAAYAITMNTTDLSSGIALGSPTSRIVFEYDGIYNLQLGLQLRNVNTSEQDATVWLAKNGTAIADTAGHITVPGRHGTVDGHTIASWNYVLEVSAGEYLELYWHGDSADLALYTYPVGTLPTHPAAPSVILTVVEVAPVVGGLGAGGGGGGGDPELGGDLSGIASNATVIAIHNNPVSATAPTVDEVLIYDGAEYVPGKLRATQLASYLTPIFTEDGAVVFDETGVVLAEVDF